MVREMEQQVSDMPDTMLEQTATVYIENIYRSLGVDMDAMQTNYILITGAKMLGLAFLGLLASVTVGLLPPDGTAVGRISEEMYLPSCRFQAVEFDHFSTASLITRSTNDIQQIQLLTVMILRIVLYAPIMQSEEF